jgi:integrase
MTPAFALPAAPETATPGAISIIERLRAQSARPQSVTVAELIDRYMAVYKGRDTSRGHRLRVWRDLIGEFPLMGGEYPINADFMRAARRELAEKPAMVFKGRDHANRRVFEAKDRKKPISAASINRHWVAVMAVFTWAIAERLTPEGFVHPCRGIRQLAEPEGRVRFLDDDERVRLLDACATSKYPRLRALVLTAMLTGARKGELMGLVWGDVDLDAGVASLDRTKNGDRRILVLLPAVVEALRPFKSSDPDRYVFGSTRTRHQTPADIKSAWLAALARARIEDFKFHDLRHTAASYMAQAGCPLNIVADVLGHRSLHMTRRYSHLVTATKAKAMAAAMGEIR